jgi:GDP-L-fucose synthase
MYGSLISSKVHEDTNIPYELIEHIIRDFVVKVLVTGGTGLVGKSLQKLRPDWVYISSNTYGTLTELNNVKTMFNDVKPDVVIHLAANVGGIFKNINKRLDMFEDNIKINTNVLSEAANRGVKRVINMLSTCIFPDGLNEPLTPSVIHKGPPHFSNEGYAYAKRVSEVHSRIIRETTNTWVTCLIPTNIYGPDDNFSTENGHVIPALISKAANETPLVVRGSGIAKRQFIHSSDLAKIVVWAAELTTNPPPMVVCCSEKEYTISEVAHMISNNVVFISGEDGQLSKKAVPGPGDFPQPSISLEDGIKMTISSYQNSLLS